MFPVIVPGCAGSVVRVTANVLAVPVPQALFPETEIVPAVDPTVVVILVVVDVPVHPVGNAQIYVVAPLTVPLVYVCAVP